MRVFRRGDKRLAAELDEELDGLTTGKPRNHPDGELGTLLATARQIHRPDSPSSTARTLPSPSAWAAILDRAPKRPATTQGPNPERWWSGRLPRFGEVVTAGLVIAVLLAGASAMGIIERQRRQPIATSTAASVFLVADGEERLYPIDPVTLADLPGAFPPLDGTPAASSNGLGSVPYAIWTASADGSTIVSVDLFSGLSTITVYDASSGAKRSRFSEAISDDVPALAADGSTVVLTSREGFSVSGTRQKPVEWLVYDTSSGRLIQRVVGDGIVMVEGVSPLLDPDGQRFHVLAFPADWQTSPPAATALRILTYDLQSDVPVNQLVIAGLGSRPALPEPSSSVPSAPAWAMSPDGRHIALVPADGGAIRLVNLDSMTVEPRQFSLAPTSDVTTWPSQNDACQGDWRIMFADFAGNTARLFVSWIETHCVDGTAVEYRSPGLRAIDLETGEERSSPVTDAVFVVPPQPEGTSVYAIRLALPETDRSPAAGGLAVREPSDVSLVRLDAGTLTVEAERSFGDDFAGVLVFPAAATPTG